MPHYTAGGIMSLLVHVGWDACIVPEGMLGESQSQSHRERATEPES